MSCFSEQNLVEDVFMFNRLVPQTIYVLGADLEGPFFDSQLGESRFRAQKCYVLLHKCISTGVPLWIAISVLR